MENVSILGRINVHVERMCDRDSIRHPLSIRLAGRGASYMTVLSDLSRHASTVQRARAWSGASACPVAAALTPVAPI